MSQTSDVGLFTFFAHIGHRGAKIPIPPLLTHLPHDWPELKDHLLDRARKAFEAYGTIEALWTLEKHTTTKVKVWRPTTRSYAFRPFSWARNVLAYFVIAYNQQSDDIVIRHATFSPTIFHLSQEYREIERNKKYEIPQLIPKTFKSFIEDPKQVVREISALRYPDYSKTPKLKYEKTPREAHTPAPTYAPFGERLKTQKER